MNTIETPRLILRPWKIETDLIPFSNMSADPRVMEFFPKILSPLEAKDFVQMIMGRFQEDGFSFWATELKETGDFIGMIGLNRPRFKTNFTPCVEVGWRIDFNHWNKGYATEGALASLKYGFQTLKLERIAAFTYINNFRSRRIMEKIGMVHDQNGDFNHPALPEDHRLSRHVLYWAISNSFNQEKFP